MTTNPHQPNPHIQSVQLFSNENNVTKFTIFWYEITIIKQQFFEKKKSLN